MGITEYTIRTPEQLIALYELHPVGNGRMMNLARVWRATRATRLREGKPEPVCWCAARFFPNSEHVAVFRVMIKGVISEAIGSIPIDKALPYCRDNLDKAGE